MPPAFRRVRLVTHWKLGRGRGPFDDLVSALAASFAELGAVVDHTFGSFLEEAGSDIVIQGHALPTRADLMEIPREAIILNMEPLSSPLVQQNPNYLELVPSSAVKHDLESLYRPMARIRIVPNGIDARDSTGDPSLLGKELGTGPDEPLTLHVGTLSAFKGVESLVDTAAEVLKIQPRARFVLIGEGSELESRMRARLRLLGIQESFHWVRRRPRPRGPIQVAISGLLSGCRDQRPDAGTLRVLLACVCRDGARSA